MRWLLLVCSVLMMNVAFAAEATKVAVVDMQRALFLSNEAKASIKKFEKDNKSDIDKLKGLEKQIKALQKKQSTDSELMSESERRKLVSEFEKQSSEFKFFARKLQQQEQVWKQEFFKAQLPELEKILKKIIDDGGYDVVVRAEAALFVKPEHNITKLLLERLNAKKNSKK